MTVPLRSAASRQDVSAAKSATAAAMRATPADSALAASAAGTVFGVTIGFFTTAENVIANPVSSLGAPALAFLAGYGVEAVFRLLDGLADQFSPARK